MLLSFFHLYAIMNEILMKSGERMEHIRRACENDLARIAEIRIFNYRLNFYPIFRNDEFYFGELQVPSLMEEYRPELGGMWVYDDGVVKGFIHVIGREIRNLFVEPVLQGQGIGAKLLEFAVREFGADTLWALEKNTRAIAFYARHGFYPTQDREPVDDTAEDLIRLARSADNGEEK